MRRADGRLRPFVSGCLAALALSADIWPAAATVPSASYTVAHQLVDVGGGRRLNLFCLGAGQPTVLFEAGLGGTTMTWRHVQDGVAAFTRACSYDRAGYGFSDPAERASDATNTVDDLHRLIAAADLRPRLVLAAHSEGGLYDTVFALSYPREVAGLVMVDPHLAAFDAQLYAQESAERRAKQLAASKAFVDSERRCLALARSGDLARPSDQRSDCLAASEALDPILEREWRRQAASVAYNAANLSEIESTASKDADGSSLDDDEVPAGPPRLNGMAISVLVEAPDRPFPGFSASEMAALMTIEMDNARALAARAAHGTVLAVAHAGHFIQDDDPDAVIEAIRSVVDGVRAVR